ncbi:hypothetical protein CCHL11_10123 [Colletotrichum chlorophyti]|uniref:N-acetyltransferase domain-containing protein n=1 Tax=Colletotrichum chlorophyti TaxID=708187 RepID=A0A1Q8RX67_9PEZI|nr:hypothetical protein CCHL11_10123 [Colletotrichum chlorophyti]
MDLRIRTPNVDDIPAVIQFTKNARAIMFPMLDQVSHNRQAEGELAKFQETYCKDASRGSFLAAYSNNQLIATIGYTAYDDRFPELSLGRKGVVEVPTGATCASACAIFLELASTQGSAHTLFVGGAPNSGLMEAVSGTPGIRMYCGDLDIDIWWVAKLNETAKARLPANRNETGIYVNYADFNLRDQLCGDDVSTSLQFRYVAADCSLYFTS